MDEETKEAIQLIMSQLEKVDIVLKELGKHIHDLDHTVNKEMYPKLNELTQY